VQVAHSKSGVGAPLCHRTPWQYRERDGFSGLFSLFQLFSGFFTLQHDEQRRSEDAKDETMIYPTTL